MKNQTLSPSELLALLAKLAPSVSIETLWKHDTDLTDIREDCEGMDDEDPDDWQAWQSEVRASAVEAGKLVSGSDYLGGTWEKACDHPAKSNPEISGYFFGMVRGALAELAKVAPSHEAEINAALESI